ncbi:NrdH-redoxin [Leucobacter insecticola]|uniref:NrdH-redoxin n=1 Tax=Leucobacter insecticola TaxID=2714934 RepID=A0A6G8FLH3_9MICO|nr:glutaredoxin domain-containing protein [Leucobacter insecticola]QIM17201.1 NrdH-redoxin [Leucobacter insecticola]
MSGEAASFSLEELAPYLPERGTVTVFSAVWCGYCRRLKAVLTRSSIVFREVLVEEDPAAERLAITLNGGEDWLIPTVIFSDASTAINPGLREVMARLAQIEDTR